MEVTFCIIGLILGKEVFSGGVFWHLNRKRYLSFAHSTRRKFRWSRRHTLLVILLALFTLFVVLYPKGPTLMPNQVQLQATAQILGKNTVKVVVRYHLLVSERYQGGTDVLYLAHRSSQNWGVTSVKGATTGVSGAAATYLQHAHIAPLATVLIKQPYGVVTFLLTRRQGVAKRPAFLLGYIHNVAYPYPRGFFNHFLYTLSFHHYWLKANWEKHLVVTAS